MFGQTAVDLLKEEVAATFERLREGLVGASDELRQTLRSMFARLYFEPEGNHWAIPGRPRAELPDPTHPIDGPCRQRQSLHCPFQQAVGLGVQLHHLGQRASGQGGVRARVAGPLPGARCFDPRPHARA